MSSQQTPSWQLQSWRGLGDRVEDRQINKPYHDAPCERAVSRRRFIRTAAGATGLILGSRLGMSGLAATPAPTELAKPIPGGIQPFGPGTELFHVFLPGSGNEPSTITDFNGFIGIAQIQGAGTGTDTTTGATTRLLYDADMRFMQGVFRGVDALVSFDVQWRGATRRVRTRNQALGFILDAIENMAIIEWSATRAGFRFVSDPASTSTTVFAEIGHERNGAFFPPI